MILNLIKSDKLKKFVAFYIIFCLGLMFRGYLLNTFYYFEFTQEPLFFSEYFFSQVFLTMWGGIILGLLNICLSGYLGYKLYDFQLGLLMALLYAISPWAAYIDIFGGNNTYILTWLLILSVSLILFKEDKRWSVYLLILSLSGFLLSSILSVFMLILMLIALYITNFLEKIKLFKVLMISFLVTVSLLIVLWSNIEASKNIFQNNSKFFYEVGLLNSVNTLRGETSQNNLGLAGKLVENKYLYNIEEFTYRLSVNFSPALFFTPQYRLFDFSFSPPIYLGFIIPCIVGIGLTLNKRRYLVASMVLLIGLSIPSVINKNSPDLAKLIVVSPIIFFYIGLGLMKIINQAKAQQKRSLYKWLFGVTVILVLFQVLIITADLSLREALRFEAFYNQFS